MVNSNASAWFLALKKEREQQRSQQQFAKAVAQNIQLNLSADGLVLAALLGQPLALSNHEALEEWVVEQLREEGMKADQAALEVLSHKLHNQLSEVIV